MLFDTAIHEISTTVRDLCCRAPSGSMTHLRLVLHFRCELRFWREFWRTDNEFTLCLRRQTSRDSALASQFPTQKRTHTQQNSSWEATTGRRVRKEIAEYIISWDLGKKEIKYLEHKNLQLVQSSTTKAENLENDFTQIAVKVQEGKKVVQVLVGIGRGPRLVKYLRVKNLTRWSKLSKATSLPSRLFLW